MALGLMAALRTFVLDTCTVATYLLGPLGEGIDSRVLHLCEFSTVFYDLIFYSNLFQCRFKDLAQQQHRKRSFLYSSYIFVGSDAEVRFWTEVRNLNLLNRTEVRSRFRFGPGSLMPHDARFGSRFNVQII